MLVGLAEAPVYYGPEEAPGDRAVAAVSTDASTITIYPATVRAATLQPRPAGLVSKVLDTIVPKKLAASGKITIWGLPPAVAYTLVAVILAGGGMWAYQKVGGRTAARNPRRRGSRGRGRARSKR